MVTYEYTNKNLLEEKETYQYSKYYGQEFLDAFFKNRTNFLDTLEKNSQDLFSLDLKSNIYQFLTKFYEKQDEIDKFMKLLQKFEVTKRIFDNTDENFKKLENAISDNLNLYILFSNCCYLAYKKINHLSCINAILKCNDILVSQKDFSNADTKMLKTAIENEIKIIKELQNEI